MMRPQGNHRFQPKPPKVDERTQKLWKALNSYILSNDGWIISPLDNATIRFECPLDSSLPDLLKSAGHDVRSLGTHERLIPTTLIEYRGSHRVTTTSVGPGVVAVYEFTLPSSEPKPAS